MDWIKSSEKLPQKGDRVLVSSIYGIQIGWLTVNGNWQFCNDGNQFTIEHWMPLPELPSEGKEGLDELPAGNCNKPHVTGSFSLFDLEKAYLAGYKQLDFEEWFTENYR